MIIEPSRYNFEESLSRLDQMLNVQGTVEDKPLTSVPLLNDIPRKGGVVAYCSVLQLEMKVSSDNSPGQLLNLYRAFLSEAVAIVSSHSHCLDVMALETRLIAVFNTPLKKDIEALIDKVAMINSLAQVLSKKALGLGLPEISVRMGIDYGKMMLMRLGKYNAEELFPNALTWIGDPVTKTAELLSATDQSMIIGISDIVYGNLSEDYRKLFYRKKDCSDYGANIINSYMKNWLNNQ